MCSKTSNGDSGRDFTWADEANRYTEGPFLSGLAQEGNLESGRTAEGYVRCEWFMDIQGQLVTEAPRRNEEERKITQKDREQRDGDKLSMRVRHGGEQDACADG
jgi:hypothetical protein